MVVVVVMTMMHVCGDADNNADDVVKVMMTMVMHGIVMMIMLMTMLLEMVLLYVSHACEKNNYRCRCAG